MSGVYGFAAISLTASIIAWLAGAVGAMLLSAHLAQTLQPDERLRRCLFVALLPAVLPALTVLALTFLALAKPLGLIADHCIEHGLGHPHFCFEHLPHLAVSGLVWGVVAILLAYPAISFFRLLVRERRLSETIRVMLSLARGSGALRILDDDRALAFTSAVQGPAVLLTTGTLRTLTRSQRRIVLAHELQHLRSGDLHWHRIVEVLLILHLPHTAKRLRSVWLQSVEERVDDAVASRFGADRVAEVLLAMARAPKSPAPLSVTGGNTLLRIRRLVERQPVPNGGAFFTWLYLACLTVLPGFVLFAHHEVETFVGLVFGV